MVRELRMTRDDTRPLFSQGLGIGGWFVAAAASAYACGVARVGDTPIDRALPFIAVVVCVVALVSEEWLVAAVPSLIACEIAIADERLRLIAFGVVLAATFAVAICSPGREGLLPKRRRHDESCATCEAAGRPYVIVAAAVALLRWIPFPDHVIRELLLLAVVLAIVAILRGTPLAIALAIITALATPMIPLRTLALPMIVLVVATIASAFGAHRIRATLPSAIAIAFVMIFFAWSGVVARALPYFFRRAQPERPRLIVNQAIAPSQSVVLDVPPGARSLIVSGANVPRLRRGTALGTLDGAPIRIGDAADWGSLRRDFYYGSRNPLPRDAAGKIRGYGYGAWIDGAGRIPLPGGARRIRVTAAATLPRDAALQIEAFE